MWLSSMIPKKFLFKYPLTLGASMTGILMCCIMVVCMIVVTIEIVQYNNCNSCSYKVMHKALAFNINALVYSVIMLFVNLWYIWGVKYEKSSVILCWVVITSMWWLQSFFVVSVLIFLYSKQVSLISWILSLVFGIIAFAILLYGVLIGFGYWSELKKNRDDPDSS